MERCTCKMAPAKAQNLQEFKVSSQSKSLCLSQFGVVRMLTYKVGVGIFFDKEGDRSPAVYTQFLRKVQAAHEVTVFFHLRPIPQPTVSQLLRKTKSLLY
jgi:KUP system potassium uptake protein